MDRYYDGQYYLACMYKAIFVLAYYGLMRIGELTHGPHVVKAKNLLIAVNKNKILIELDSSKTHGKESLPQRIKISEVSIKNCTTNRVRIKNRFFCPFKVVRRFMNLRGGYYHEDEQFFVFRDYSPVYPTHVRSLLQNTAKEIEQE